MAHEQYDDFSVEAMERYMDQVFMEAVMSDSSMTSPTGTVSPSMLFSPGSGNDHFAGNRVPPDQGYHGPSSPISYAPSTDYNYSTPVYGMQLQQTFSSYGGSAGTPISGSSGFYGGASPFSASVASPVPASTHPTSPSVESSSSRKGPDPRAFAPNAFIDNAWNGLMADLSRVPKVDVSDLRPLQSDLAFDPNKKFTDADMKAVEAQLKGVPAADPSQTTALDSYLTRKPCSQQDVGHCPPDWDSCRSCSSRSLQCTLSNDALSKYTARKDERDTGSTPWWKEKGVNVNQQTIRRTFPTCRLCSRKGYRCEFEMLKLPSEARAR